MKTAIFATERAARDASTAIANSIGLGASGATTRVWAEPVDMRDGTWAIPLPDHEYAASTSVESTAMSIVDAVPPVVAGLVE